ncbi:MAG: peptide deformylase [Oscillospiraceae bacterium]|nr:peptide deformylase [Oscillospiraceae bacterium]
MVKPIIKDVIFLSQKAMPATQDDTQTARDLIDTLEAHIDECVGMAANMIGVNKNIIVFKSQGECVVMMNPRIIKCSGEYEAKEGCLSLSGVRPAKRYKSIKVSYYTTDFRERVKNFTDFTAQIIQHEIDHCNGIII